MTQTSKKQHSSKIASTLLKVKDGQASFLPSDKWLIKTAFRIAKNTKGTFPKLLAVAACAMGTVACAGFAVGAFFAFPLSSAMVLSGCAVLGGLVCHETMKDTQRSLKKNQFSIIQNEMTKAVLGQQKQAFLDAWKNGKNKNKTKTNTKDNAKTNADALKTQTPTQEDTQPKKGRLKKLFTLFGGKKDHGAKNTAPTPKHNTPKP